MNLNEILDIIQKHQIEFVDLKTVDIYGVWKHVTIPAKNFTEKIFLHGIGFDASNFGYANVEKSDMIMIPDPKTAFFDTFGEYPTLSFICDIFDPQKGEKFDQDPRNILAKTLQKIQENGIADEIKLAPEYEFHVAQNVTYQISPNIISLKLDSCEGFWNSDKSGEYFIGRKRGYHRTPPFDNFFALRNRITDELLKLGIPVKYHHHEVGTSQLEIETDFMDALQAADVTLLCKYVIRNLAKKSGFLVTFLAKPMPEEAGNGMHIHQFFMKDGKNVFAGDRVYGLSETALYYISGILKHSPALLALTNPTTNSYRRLVPGYEAPISAVFALGNRTSAIRIPGYVREDAKRRIEFRTIDATCNPYLAFAAMILAGVDGIISKIDPTTNGYGPVEQNLDKCDMNPLPKNLEEAILSLQKDNEFLKRWDIFPQPLLDKWATKKLDEYRMVSSVPHPMEYQLYFDL